VFETVLVADRSATARRVVRTCQRLGARTAVVHGDDDGGSPAVRAADEAVPLGGSGWADSYGDPLRVLEAAQRTGAEAVHPGAGWLAEDPALARAVHDAGLVWLGVAPEALERTEEQTAALVRELGLTPAAGRPAPRLLVATTVQDGAGVRLLGLREQLRIEGAPALDLAPAALPAEVQQRCEHAALVVARAAGAGPLAAVGLALDGDDVTVLSVLPPLLPGSSATETATGVDLVALGLCLAADDPAPDASPGASAVALHLRAGDRYAGRLRRWSLPDDDGDGNGPRGLRVDAAVRKGDRLQVGSDRTLAVLTVGGSDAADALSRARATLDAVVVEGLPSSLPALHALLADRAPTT
jgi:acetyl/propionyl-CoA carboxylase alpha subunit